MIENVNQLWDEATVGVHIFPNAHAPMEPGGFPVQLFWPVGPDKSVMELLLVGAKEDEVNESYWDALCADMDIVVQEDVRLLSKIQRRSEEHTSELQSLMRISYAVFCLKKKKNKI